MAPHPPPGARDGLMTAGSITVGAAPQWGGDGLVTMIRNWLHIH